MSYRFIFLLLLIFMPAIAQADGTGPGGGVVPSGIYFYEARLGARVQSGKMALVK